MNVQVHRIACAVWRGRSGYYQTGFGARGYLAPADRGRTRLRAAPTRSWRRRPPRVSHTKNRRPWTGQAR